MLFCWPVSSHLPVLPMLELLTKTDIQGTKVSIYFKAVLKANNYDDRYESEWVFLQFLLTFLIRTRHGIIFSTFSLAHASVDADVVHSA